MAPKLRKCAKFLNKTDHLDMIKISLLCLHCNSTFESSAELEVHIKKCLERKYSCNDCDAKFRRSEHLQRHISCKHSIKATNGCPVCRQQFKRRDTLFKHIVLAHSSTQDFFNCSECEFQASTHKELQNHELKNHLLSERHSCPKCDGTFKRRDHMLRHYRSQHLNESFKCLICDLIYTRKDHITRHMMVRHQMQSNDENYIKISQKKKRKK